MLSAHVLSADVPKHSSSEDDLLPQLDEERQEVLEYQIRSSSGMTGQWIRGVFTAVAAWVASADALPAQPPVPPSEGGPVAMKTIPKDEEKMGIDLPKAAEPALKALQASDIEWKDSTVTFSQNGSRIRIAFSPAGSVRTMDLWTPHPTRCVVNGEVEVRHMKTLCDNAPSIFERLRTYPDVAFPSPLVVTTTDGVLFRARGVKAGAEKTFVATTWNTLQVEHEPGEAQWAQWAGAAAELSKAQESYVAAVQMHVPDKALLTRLSLDTPFHTIHTRVRTDLALPPTTAKLHAASTEKGKVILEHLAKQLVAAATLEQQRRATARESILRTAEGEQVVSEQFPYNFSLKYGNPVRMTEIGGPGGLESRTTIKGSWREVQRYEAGKKSVVLAVDTKTDATLWTELYQNEVLRTKDIGNHSMFFDASGRPTWAMEKLDEQHQRIKFADPRGKMIGTFAEERKRNPKLSVDQYFLQLKDALDTPEKLHVFSKHCWQYTWDTPDRRYPRLPGTRQRHGQYAQTVQETLLREENGKYCGDCEDIAWLFRKFLLAQGVNAHVLSMAPNPEDPEAGAHAFCAWMQRRPDGRLDAYTACNFGVSRNGLGISGNERDQRMQLLQFPDHPGFTTAAEAVREFTTFFKHDASTLNAHRPRTIINVRNGDYEHTPIDSDYLLPEVHMDLDDSEDARALEKLLRQFYVMFGLPVLAFLLRVRTSWQKAFQALRKRRTQLRDED